MHNLVKRFPVHTLAHEGRCIKGLDVRAAEAGIGFRERLVSHQAVLSGQVVDVRVQACLDGVRE
jgi:hypothetical protein